MKPKTKTEFHVKVLAWNKHIIIWPSLDIAHRDWAPTEQKSGRMGSVILDSKKSLRISEEAISLLNRLENGLDDVGDIDWWEMQDKKRSAFSWWGGIYRVINPNRCIPARGFWIRRDRCTIIPNDTSLIDKELEQVFKGVLVKKHAVWRPKVAIDNENVILSTVEN